MIAALALAALPPLQLPDPEPFWSYAIMGHHIGESGIVAVEANGRREIFCAAQWNGSDGNSYWYSLRHDPSSGDWIQTHVSGADFEWAGDGIVALDVGRLLPGAPETLAVLHGDGLVELFDPASKAPVGSFVAGAGAPKALDLADFDGDGFEDLYVLGGSWLRIHSAAGALLGSAGVGGEDVVVAQMDADPQSEIAVTDGLVLDGATLAVQWTWPGGFGFRLDAADVDGDGMAELFVLEQWSSAWCYDVDLQLPRWDLPVSDGAAILLADLESDGAWELLVGENQLDDIAIYDARTAASRGLISGTERSVTNLLVADADGDGDQEVIWGAGSDRNHRLHVSDWPSGAVSWQSEHLDGPLTGPGLGDPDADGRPEFVVGCFESESGYADGRLLVFDARTLRLEAMSAPIAGSRADHGLRDLRLRDVDNDGAEEIVIATDRDGAGLIEMYGYAGGTFNLEWTNPTPRPSLAPFRSVEIADLDLDGDLEAVAGVERYLSSGDHNLFYVYDIASVAEEWRSPETGSNGDEVTRLEVADTDGDGRPEFLGMVEETGLFVYDGTTKALEALLPGPFTALQILPAGAKSYILLGDVDGRVSAYLWNGASYVQVFRRRLALDAVQGITPGEAGTAWIGAAGRLSLVAPAAGALLWQSDDYGGAFGTRVIATAGATVPFFTSGLYSLTGFR